MSKIKYNKEKPGRLLSGGGPRDLQHRQKLMQQEQIIRDLVISESRHHPSIIDKNKNIEKSQLKIDLSQYIPLEEVKRKIEDAVSFIKKEEKIKFENELSILSNELSNIKKKLNEKDIKITELQFKLETKESIYESSIFDFKKLQEKLEQLYNKIADGSIKPFVGSKMDRPSLEDKIFIDPLSNESNVTLDSHIEITEEASQSELQNRDLNNDLAKLRALLSK